jgi:hypothetical protein
MYVVNLPLVFSFKMLSTGKQHTGALSPNYLNKVVYISQLFIAFPLMVKYYLEKNYG